MGKYIYLNFGRNWKFFAHSGNFDLETHRFLMQGMEPFKFLRMALYMWKIVDWLVDIGIQGNLYEELWLSVDKNC